MVNKSCGVRRWAARSPQTMCVRAGTRTYSTIGSKIKQGTTNVLRLCVCLCVHACVRERWRVGAPLSHTHTHSAAKVHTYQGRGGTRWTLHRRRTVLPRVWCSPTGSSNDEYHYWSGTRRHGCPLQRAIRTPTQKHMSLQRHSAGGGRSRERVQHHPFSLRQQARPYLIVRARCPC